VYHLDAEIVGGGCFACGVGYAKTFTMTLTQVAFGT